MNNPQCCKCGKIGQLFVTSDGKAYCDVCYGSRSQETRGKENHRAPDSPSSSPREERELSRAAH